MKNKSSPRIAAWLLLSCLIPPMSGQAEELNQKIGQMLMVGFRGFELEETHPIIADIVDRNIGGVILFDYDVPSQQPVRNIESPSQVAALTACLQALRDDPLLIAVDQEGGRIRRLKEDYGFGPTVSHEFLGEINDPDFTRSKAGDIARMVVDHGFNMNLAPVVDVNTNPESPAIGALERSFSPAAGIVGIHAFEYIAAHRNHGVITALKHFPGHGSAEADTHLGFTDVTHTWDPLELEPYAEIIASGVCDVVMTAHVFNETWDPDYPATLSHNVLHSILRGQLGFQGVIISDDMQMGAITEHYTLRTALEKSINAGVDLLIFANNSVFDPDIAEQAIGLIRDLVDEGKIPEARIHESYARIQALKAKAGLTPFERWQQLHFTESELANQDLSAAGSSLLGDGVSNIEKFLAGISPREQSNPDTRSQLTWEAGGDAEGPVFSFRRYRPATDITIAIDYSDDLATWEPVAGPLTRDYPGERDWETLSFSDAPPENGNARFYRLRLEREASTP